MNATAKVFWTGRSQALRLPKEFRFDVSEVRIRREGRSVILEIPDDVIGGAAADEIDRLRALIQEGIDSGPDEPWDVEEIKRAARAER